MKPNILLAVLAALTFVPFSAPVHALDDAADKSATEARSPDRLASSDGPLRRALRGALKRWMAFREETPLTAQQRTQIRDVLKPHRDEIRTQLTAMREAQHQLRKAASSDADLKAAADKVGDAARQGALLRGRLAREIRPILTPEQRQRLDSAIEEFQSEAGKLGASR